MGNRVELTPEQQQELRFTEQEREELKRARELPITFDSDCPETTPERAIRFRRVNPHRDGSRYA